MDALRSVLSSPSSPNTDEESGILGGFQEVTRLSWSTRIQCFLGCFLLGILMSILGSVVLFFNPIRGLTSFSILYTFGNIFSICSTMFLMGPMKQLKNIFAEKRIVASITVIVTFVLTFVAAFVVKSAVLALVMIIIQSLAMTWYSLSYIPYARDAVIKLCGSLC